MGAEIPHRLAVDARHDNAPCVAVFDIGKTNVKFSLVDPSAHIAFETRMPNEVIDAAPYPHADVEAIWRFLVANLDRTSREFSIEAVVTVAHGATAALVDDAGALVLPILDYEHRGPEEITAAYEALRAPFSETQSPSLPCGLNLGRQLLWQQTRFPAQFARARRLLTYPQYWTSRMTGKALAEMTALGCHTDLWCPAARDYSGLVDRLSIRNLLPALSGAASHAGPIKAGLAEMTGLRADTPVLTGIHDSASSFFKHRAGRTDPFIVLSSGTWLIAMAGNAGAVALDPSRDCLANVETGGAPVPTARFMAGREYETIAGSGDSAWIERNALEDALDAVMASGQFAMPNHGGEGGPFPGRTGSFVGRAPAGHVERHALASLYVALMANECIDLVGGKGDIVIEGPLGRNHLFAPLLQALRPHQPIRLSSDRTGAALGAARLAWPALPEAPLAACSPLDAKIAGRVRNYHERWLALV